MCIRDSAVVVQHALRGRVGQAADSGREDRTEFDALVAEAVAPAHRVAGRELAHLAEVGFGDREVARRRIDLDVAVQVALKLVIDVNIAHRTARTQDDLRRHVARAQPVLLNLVVGDGLARHGVHFAGRQPLDLVAVERKGCLLYTSRCV